MTDSPKVAKFNDIDLNVFPYILRRDPTGIVNYVALYKCPKNHPQYEQLKGILTEQFKYTKIGKGVQIDLLDTIDFKKYKHSMYYILDLRSDPDASLNPITLKNANNVSSWVYNRFTHELLSLTKGLIVFMDDINDVSPYLLSKSITGLCDSNLEKFLDSSCATRIGHKKIDNQDLSCTKLKGYISGEKWTRLTVLD
jgi:hypothetical protein